MTPSVMQGASSVSQVARHRDQLVGVPWVRATAATHEPISLCIEQNAPTSHRKLRRCRTSHRCVKGQAKRFNGPVSLGARPISQRLTIAAVAAQSRGGHAAR